MRLHRALGGLLGLLLWTSATAAPLTYEFHLNWSAGPLAGTIDVGHLVIDGDDCAGSCSGVFSPGDAAATLLDLSIEVGGLLYTAIDDGLFPVFPQVTLSAGHLVNIDFEALVGGMQLVLFEGLATHFPPGFPSGPDRSFGFVSFVPEPGTALLVASALLLVPALRRRSGERPGA